VEGVEYEFRHRSLSGLRMFALGHELPRRSLAGEADIHPITDTKATSRRDRFGPTSASRTAAKTACLVAVGPL
jgi:hypothetical protein